MSHRTSPFVLFAADAPGTRDTGLGRHQWHLARELERRGFQVAETYSEDAPLSGPRYLRRFHFPWAVFSRARDAARSQSPFDALIVHEGSAGLVCLARRLGLLQAPCMVVSHNTEQKVWETNLDLARRGLHSVPVHSRVFWPLTRLWQSNFALRHADWVVCLSAEDRAFIERRFGVSPERITQLNNGVAEGFFQSPSNETRPRILFLGTWLPHKGTHALAPALAAVLEKHPEARASLLGTGLPEAFVRRDFPNHLAARMDVQSRVPPEVLETTIRNHNIFVLPSWFEGMPLSLLEAMASGLAVVVTNVGGMREVVRGGLDGIVVAAHDSGQLAQALERLCADPALRTQLANAAMQRARLFSWQKAGETLAEAVHAMIASQAPQPHGVSQKARA